MGAIRVRKLAREVTRDPEEVLGLLRDLGFSRYKSAEDMVAHNVAVKVRQAARAGVRAEPIPSVASRRSQPTASQASSGADLMAQLVPGVVPSGRSKPQPPPEPAPRPRPVAEPDPRDQEIAALREQLATARAEASDLASRLEEVLQPPAPEPEEAPQPEPLAASDGSPTLIDLLHERGLRGADEGERAFAALARLHALRDLIVELQPRDAARIAALLDKHLVLVGGTVPEGLDGGVTVSPDRAELGGAEDIERQLGRVGELLLLHGLRRVRVIGGAPRWHRLVRAGLDDRLEVDFQPPRPSDRVAAEQDAARCDAVVLWGTRPTPVVEEVYAAGRARVVAIDTPTLAAFSESIIGALLD